MTQFIDGPAEGQALHLKRSPTFLRVTKDRVSGSWDALDILEDTPTDEEDVYVYQLNSEPGICHTYSRKPGASGWCMIAEYKLCVEQPIYDRDKREHAHWVEWVMSHTHLCDVKGKELAPHLR